MTAEASIRVEPIERGLLDGVHEYEGEPERARVDLGLVPVFSDERPLHGLAGLLDWRGAGRLSKLLRSGFCRATIGEQLLVPGDRRLPADRLVLVGLGPRADFDDARGRAIAAQLVKISSGLGARRVLIALPGHGVARALTEATFEGLLATIREADGTEDGAAASRATDDSEAVEAAAPASQARDTPSETARSHERSHESARWWVAADGAVVPRLRRLLSGPPRAARGGASLHT